VIQLVLLAAFQAQPVCAVTVTDPLAPAAADVVLGGASVAPQPAAAACVTLKVWPAMVTVPVRDEVAAFAATK
jgi:hypothetical protein